LLVHPRALCESTSAELGVEGMDVLVVDDVDDEIDV